MGEDKATWLAGLADAAKGTWAGLEASAIIASSPAVAVENAGMHPVDPVVASGLSALAGSGEALQSAVGARNDGDEVGEATDVVSPDTTSLVVDPPSWLADSGDGLGEDAADAGDATRF
jgi:hypothetical protein